MNDLTRCSLLLRLRFDGRELSTGTGFVVSGPGGTPTLISNYHVLSGRHPETNQPLAPSAAIPNEVAILHHSEREGEWVERVETLVKDDGSPRWYVHPELGTAVDLAALTLSQLDDVALCHVNYSSAAEPHVRIGPADAVSIIGFPFGRTGGRHYPIWVRGAIASEPLEDFDGRPTFVVDCRSREGQSGSPVFWYAGGGMVALESGDMLGVARPVSRFLGVYSGRISAESDLGIVWKADVLRSFMYWQADY